MITELEILQIVNIVVILITLFTVISVASIKRYRHFWLWFIPVLILLLNSLIFRSVLLVDALDGQLNIANTTYNFWSDVVHLQDKLTILIYAVAILLQNWKTNFRESELLKTVLTWTKQEEDK